MKKALAIILVAIICIGILPVSVSAAESNPQTCSESFTAEEAYQDFLYRITHFKLDTLSDFIFWLVIAIVAIIIAIVIFIVIVAFCQLVVVPILTIIGGGPIGAAVGEAISVLVSAVVGLIGSPAILIALISILPDILEIFFK